MCVLCQCRGLIDSRILVGGWQLAASPPRSKFDMQKRHLNKNMRMRYYWITNNKEKYGPVQLCIFIDWLPAAGC